MTTAIRPPILFADFTTEGAGNNYLFNNNKFAGFAAWLTALGGTSSGTLTFSSRGLFIDNTVSISVTPISSWYNAVVGTLFGRADTTVDDGGICKIFASGGGPGGLNRFDLRAALTGGQALAAISANGSNIFVPVTTDAGQSPFTSGQASGAALAAQATGFTYIKDGGTADLGGAGTMPLGADTLLLGHADIDLTGHLAQFGYWNVALSIAELQALTTNQFTFLPVEGTVLVPGKHFTKKQYADLLDDIREEVRAEQEAIGGLDEKGRADRDFDIAQRMLNELESNLGPTNYAKTMDAREKLESARKERDHHYYMEIVKKAWAEFNDRKLSRL